MPSKLHMAPLALAALLAIDVNTANAAEQVVKIGVSGPLSGSNAFAGKDNENGVRLAIEELNAQKLQVGGNTIRFELQSEDDQGDPKQGVNVAQKFADAKVKFVLGPYNSGVAIPASRVYNDNGILMSTVGTNPKITQSGYPTVFRIVASDTQVGGSVAAYAAKELKVKNVGVIDDRTAFGQGVAMEFKRQATANGMKVAGHEYTTDKATDFAAILTSLKAKRVDAVFFGGYAPQAAPMARQMKALCAARRWPSWAARRSARTCAAPRPARLSPNSQAAPPSSTPTRRASSATRTCMRPRSTTRPSSSPRP